MIDLTTLEIPNDAQILESWFEPYGAASLTVAEELNLFEVLMSGAQDVTTLSQALGIEREGCLALARVLVNAAYLNEQPEERFALTALARTYWSKSSTLYRGVEFHGIRNSAAHQRTLAALRQNGRDNSITAMWEAGDIVEDEAERFTNLMHSIMLAPAIAEARSDAFDGVKEIIDAGGGSGAFCAAFVAHHPTRRATVMDLPQVCAEARRHVERFGQQDRVNYVGCNFFSDIWPSHGDAYHFSNILHDWPIHKAMELLTHSYNALPPGGQIFIHEVLLEEGRARPRAAVLFNLLMYINHRAQQFTQHELEEMLSSVGYENTEVVHTFGYYSLLRAQKPLT